jgi:hypothetical protein
VKTDLLAVLTLIAAFAATPTAGAVTLRLPSACASAIAKDMPDWKPVEPPEDAAIWARNRGWNPIVAAGDFDGNGSADWAALGSSKGKSRLAVCMNAKSHLKLLVIDDPYCADLIHRARARSKHYNFETGRTELIKNDGVSVSCFEKAGATYVYEREGFRRIIDSD